MSMADSRNVRSRAGRAASAGGDRPASDVENNVRAVIHRSCLLLDEERFDKYLALWAPAGRYRITSYSPDIRKDLVLLDLGRDDYGHLLSNIRNHEHMPGTFSRHLSVQLLERDEGTGKVHVTSSILVIHTDPEGVSRVFATGRYLDVFVTGGDQPLIELREARLTTRQFGPGSHIPI